MRPFLFRWFCISLVVGLVLRTMGAAITTWAGLIAAALFLGLINALTRPVLLRLGLPAVMLTSAVLLLLLNAAFFAGFADAVPIYQFATRREAFIAAVIVSVVSWVTNLFFRGSDGHVHPVTYHGTVAGSAAPAADKVEQ